MLDQRATEFQYLFLGGIFGEVLSLPFVGNYLRENRRILRELGIEDVHCRTLSSLSSVDQNAGRLGKLVSELSKTSSKPLIIVGHSKACLELILAILNETELFRRSVHRVVCVQPPFMGSEMLNLLGLKAVAKFWPGLASLVPGRFSQLFLEDSAPRAPAKAYIEEKVLIIKGHQREPLAVAWVIRPSHFYMGLKGDSNDGLVRLCDQSLPNVRCQELTMEMDHSDLFTSERISTRPVDFRRSAMQELINLCVAGEESRSLVMAQ